VTIVATPGHTVGHASLLIQSSPDAAQSPGRDPGERLIILGDAFHGLVEFDHPEWVSSLDDDPQQTELTRRHLLQELARPNTLGSCIHFPDSAFGRLLAQENGGHQWQSLKQE
jgi:glyoxylase-like metal-dependent hydrolase (beta-lactamase superfamily II)